MGQFGQTDLLLDRIQTNGTRMAGDSAPDQAVLDHRTSQQCSGVQRRITRIIDEHGNAAPQLARQCTRPLDVCRHVLLAVLDLRDPADDIGPETQGLLAQRRHPGVAQQPVLWKGVLEIRPARMSMSQTLPSRMRALCMSTEPPSATMPAHPTS
ncbi:MAG: hypothetical protein ACR2JG_07860 [Geodermatophilaceae bacterium]